MHEWLDTTYMDVAYINDLVQNCSNSIADALEILQWYMYSTSMVKDEKMSSLALSHRYNDE